MDGGGTAGAPVVGDLRGIVGAGSGGAPALVAASRSLGFDLSVTRTVSLRSGTADVFLVGFGLLSSVMSLIGVIILNGGDAKNILNIS